MYQNIKNGNWYYFGSSHYPELITVLTVTPTYVIYNTLREIETHADMVHKCPTNGMFENLIETGTRFAVQEVEQYRKSISEQHQAQADHMEYVIHNAALPEAWKQEIDKSHAFEEVFNTPESQARLESYNLFNNKAWIEKYQHGTTLDQYLRHMDQQVKPYMVDTTYGYGTWYECAIQHTCRVCGTQTRYAVRFGTWYMCRLCENRALIDGLTISDYDYLWHADTTIDPRDTQVYEPTKTLVICAICQTETNDPVYNDARAVCGECNQKITAYAERIEARRERLEQAAERAMASYQTEHDHAHGMAERIPFGQPILVGHHSESRDRRYRGRIEATYRRAFESLKKAEYYQDRAHAAAKNRAISSDDPAAVIKLREKLAHLEAWQDEAKRINKIMRSVLPRPTKTQKQQDEERRAAYQSYTSLDDLNAKLSAVDAEEKALMRTYPDYAPKLAEKARISLERATKLLKPDFAGRLGIPDYETTNNGAEIRRIKARIDDLMRQHQQAAVLGNEETMIGAVRIEKNREENRLRLYFPGKPAQTVIDDLKRHGFHWSRTEGAWQRMLSYDAEQQAKRIAENI